MSRTANARRREISGRALREWCASAPTGSPLRVDRDAGVIYGVKVLGFRSRNSHGLKEAADGTEYTRRCMEEALPLYEGVDVLTDHDHGPTPRAGRSAKVDDPRLFGVLREARVGDDGIRADLHYFRSHPLAERVLEDVERGLGRFGLSHDASAKRERFDPASRRLVIESLATVRSVDLVRKPATNRNLWESEPVSTTLREQLEERLPKWKGNRRKWANRLLEDDTGVMAPAMDAPAEVADGGDEDDALWTGFQAAISKILEKYKAGDMTPEDAAKAVKDYLKTHDKLTGAEEPEAPSEDAPADPPSDPAKTEAEKENAALKHKLAVRELCEELKVSPDRTLLESLEGLPLPQARRLVEREKSRGGNQPKGGPPSGVKPPAKKPSGKSFVDAITE